MLQVALFVLSLALLVEAGLLLALSVSSAKRRVAFKEMSGAKVVVACTVLTAVALLVTALLL